MIQDRLWLEVEKVAERYQRLRFWRALTVGWFVAAIIGVSLAAMGVESARNVATVLPLLGGVAAVLVLVCAWLVTASAPSHDWVARQIENEFPDLRSCLLAAVEQQPALPDGRFGFLQESVIRQALVLLADHELNASTFTTRVAASTGISLYDAVAAGLAALKGSHHGGATTRAARFVQALNQKDALKEIRARAALNEPVPGFGRLAFS